MAEPHFGAGLNDFVDGPCSAPFRGIAAVRCHKAMPFTPSMKPRLLDMADILSRE